MNPDHPLLRRAQEALKRQLQANKLRLEEELREKQNTLQAAKVKREAVGVELYGFQQNLAKLQLALEKTHETYQTINQVRMQVEEELLKMRSDADNEEVLTKSDRTKVERFQSELDKLAATLKQIEAYNEQMKSEIAVTRRAAYAAEEAAQKLEKDKLKQDFRIETLQETMKSMHQQLALYNAQLEAQKRETRAALETLAEAETEMESVYFEKKQLVAQWKSSLLAIQRRDEALEAINTAIREQYQQTLAIDTEIDGYKRDITKEQIKNEQLTAVLKKVEGEAQFIIKQIEACVEKQQRLQEMFSKLHKSLDTTEEQLRRQDTEAKAILGEQGAVDKAHLKVVNELRGIEEEMVKALSDQTTAERSGHKAASDINELRRRVRDEELHVVEVQNEMAKLQVDLLNTEAHNARLTETLALLDEELTDKSRAIEKYEVEIKRRNDEIERKTRDIDSLNKKYDKLVSGMEDENTGPLEATINNLAKEIDHKGLESTQLQRRWIACQTELVSLQNENSTMGEAVTRLRSERTIIIQRRKRLESQYEHHCKEIKGLQANMTHLHQDLARVNSQIAANSSAREMLQEDNFNLEFKIMGELRDMEEESARLGTAIDAERNRKREVMAEIIEVERQIMLWERKIQLEKEMREVLDPTVGDDVVGEMKREIHRMTLRHGELLRLQEKLIADMERALGKRDVISMKGRAANTKKGQEMTRQQLDKAVQDLTKSIKDTEKEIAATDGRIRTLDGQNAELSRQVAQVDGLLRELRDKAEALLGAVHTSGSTKYRLLLATMRQQKSAKRWEDIDAGKYKPQVEDPSQLDAELSKAGSRRSKILSLVEELRVAHPHLGPDLDRLLAHVA